MVSMKALMSLSQYDMGVPILTRYILYFLKTTAGEYRSSPTAFFIRI